MSKKKTYRKLRNAALTLTAAWVAPVPAATLSWDIIGNTAGLGGTGAWDTSSAFWNTNATGTGGTVSAWNNGNVDDAIFAGTAGAVTLGAPVTVGNVTFNTTGYTLTGSTLTLGGATPTITTGTGIATINSAIAGTAGLTKAGAGTLTLNGTNIFSGGINVNAGILSVNSDAALGAASNGIVMVGGTQLTSGVSAFAASRVVTLSSGNVTLSGAGLGTARFTGAGGITALGGINLRNNASDYTGQIQFAGANGSTYSFTSIADLGVASSLGAPTTVVNGTVLLAPTSGSGVLSYTGTGSSSNRNLELRTNTGGGGSSLRNAGSGTLTLTGSITLAGNSGVSNTLFTATGGDMALLGVIADIPAAVRGASFTGSVGRTITLGGANTYRSVTNISGVTVRAPVLADRLTASSFGTASASISNINVTGGGTVSYIGTGGGTNRIWALNAGTVSNDGSGPLALSGGVPLAGAGTFAGSFSGAPNTLSGVVSGVGRLTIGGAGTWVLTNTNTYTGGTTINGGTLQLGNGGITGSIGGDVIDNGALVMNRSDAVTFGGAISGTGTLTKLGADTLTLTADNSYTGTTTIAAGTLQLGNGASTGGIVGNVVNGGALVINRSNAFSYGGAISGAGSVSQIGSGTTTLGGDSSAFSGHTSVNSGSLWVNGILGNAASTLSVGSGGTLGGTGTVGGSVAVADGVLAPGNSPGTLTINGDLSLAPASTLDYEFGQAGVGGPLNDLTVVGGNLTLDGTINVAVPPGGTYGPGLYRVISYGGTLTDNGLALGTLPAGSTNLVQTSIAGQVNLINTAGLTLNFWDGSSAPRHDGVVNGGNGVWQAAAGNDNWSDSTGAVNGAYTDGSFAIFAGSPGNVTVDTSLGAVVSGGMQFATNGYVVQGQPITLAAGGNMVRVGDGTAPGAGYVATIGSELAGSGGVDKTDLGTLVLTGTNSYTGGTTISAGTLQLGNGGTTGSVVGDVTDNGTLAFNRSDDFTFGGVISGTGAVTQLGPNTLTFTGGNTYAGATTVAAGTLRAGAANTFSPASAHSVAAGATLDLAGFDQRVASLANSGTVSLPGSAPGTTLTVTGPYQGNNGVLRLGTSLSGNASVSDRLVLDGPTAAASGNTSVQITNLGGLGALTTGNGIELIGAIHGATTTAQTSKNAFALAGGHVDAGAFEYRLYAADASGAGENWYLRSTTTLEAVPPDPAPIPPTATPPVIVPTFRSEVPLFASLPAQLRRGSLAMLGNLHQRIGDNNIHSGGGTDTAATGGTRRAWARLIDTSIDISQEGSVNPHSDGRLNGLQAGTDLFADAGWRAGVYVGQIDGDVNVDGFARGVSGATGSNDLRNQYLAGYATWTGATGLYVDAVLQAGRHPYTIKPLTNAQASGKARSVLASVEVGQPFPIAERWALEPQVQLVHEHLSFDDVSISGALVQQRPDRAWLARIGARLKGEFATAAGALQPYARVNLYWGSGGDDVTRFVGAAASTDIASSIGYSTAELAGGFTLALNPKVDVYGEAGKLFDVGGDSRVRSGVQGSLGMRVKW